MDDKQENLDSNLLSTAQLRLHFYSSEYGWTTLDPNIAAIDQPVHGSWFKEGSNTGTGQAQLCALCIEANIPPSVDDNAQPGIVVNSAISAEFAMQGQLCGKGRQALIFHMKQPIENLPFPPGFEAFTYALAKTNDDAACNLDDVYSPLWQTNTVIDPSEMHSADLPLKSPSVHQFTLPSQNFQGEDPELPDIVSSLVDDNLNNTETEFGSYTCDECVSAFSSSYHSSKCDPTRTVSSWNGPILYPTDYTVQQQLNDATCARVDCNSSTGNNSRKNAMQNIEEDGRIIGAADWVSNNETDHHMKRNEYNVSSRENHKCSTHYLGTFTHCPGTEQNCHKHHSGTYLGSGCPFQNALGDTVTQHHYVLCGNECKRYPIITKTRDWCQTAAQRSGNANERYDGKNNRIKGCHKMHEHFIHKSPVVEAPPPLNSTQCHRCEQLPSTVAYFPFYATHSQSHPPNHSSYICSYCPNCGGVRQATNAKHVRSNTKIKSVANCCHEIVRPSILEEVRYIASINLNGMHKLEAVENAELSDQRTKG